MPVNMKQRAMNPEDSAQMTAQLKLWEQQDLIRPIDSEWNSALLSVAKKNTTAKRFVIDLRPLNTKCKKINLYIGSVKQISRSSTASRFSVPSTCPTGLEFCP